MRVEMSSKASESRARGSGERAKGKGVIHTEVMRTAQESHWERSGVRERSEERARKRRSGGQRCPERSGSPGAAHRRGTTHRTGTRGKPWRVALRGHSRRQSWEVMEATSVQVPTKTDRRREGLVGEILGKNGEGGGVQARAAGLSPVGADREEGSGQAGPREGTLGTAARPQGIPEPGRETLTTQERWPAAPPRWSLPHTQAAAELPSASLPS